MTEFTGHPRTWYVAGFSRDLRPGEIANNTLAGKAVTLYRTASGSVQAIDPTCPHQGAHIGKGGFVKGNNIHCPFHQFAYAPDGRCVSTGWGAPPPKVSLAKYPAHEANGLIYLWMHPDSPEWTPKTYDTARYTQQYAWARTYRGHPLDPVENGTDYQHFRFIHHIEPATPITPMVIDKHILTLNLLVPGFWTSYRPTHLTLCFEGPGIATGHIEIPGTPFHAMEIACFTEREPGRVTIYKLSRATLDIPLGPAKLLTDRILAYVTGKASAKQFRSDIRIWEHRKLLAHPRLTEGEQDIAACRRWARQFYEG
ncbi:Rieske 2Fe-2S domain-containing protein [Streptomyces sp. NRRL B-1347]|uniref:Rieske 2Fe-2S domain-containing protein n=1 Tax=Streptomyces sp. NRRL B-1347 TaxID=1476877 RepID=UPI00099DF35A|nr:Rieske 2Fe-2S domain-containing protein [Streptomyces sp. NRRL B-1347]